MSKKFPSQVIRVPSDRIRASCSLMVVAKEAFGNDCVICVIYFAEVLVVGDGENLKV